MCMRNALQACPAAADVLSFWGHQQSALEGALNIVCNELPCKYDSVLRLIAITGGPWCGATFCEQKNEPHRDKTNKMACAPSEDSDQPEHRPSLIRVFAVRLKKVIILSYPLSAQRGL